MQPTNTPKLGRVRSVVIFSSLVMMVVIACAAGWRAHSFTAPTHITLFLSGDSRGYLEPCGCRRDQAGGLPGRAAIIGTVPRKTRLVLDFGNMTSGSRPYELMKLRYMMEGMATIGYDGVNIGKKEAALDLPALQQMLTSPLPFVSANVCTKRDGLPVTLPYRTVSYGNVTIGITGVTSVPADSAGPGILIKPPLEALAEVIPTVRRKCNYLIVLACMDADTMHRAADQFPEIDCILGGDVPQSSSSLLEFNRASNFNVTDKGKVIGKIDLALLKDGNYHSVNGIGIKVMGDKLAANPSMIRLIAKYKAELRDKRYELASAEGLERIQSQESTADEYVGSSSCIACHKQASDVAAGTAHVHAFETLVKKGSEFDPDCLRCHTVGYAQYRGFIDTVKTPALENVQCESCHGRGKAHIQAMQAKANGAASPALLANSKLRTVTPASCVRCHDEENSENFNYSTFWPKIAHK